MMNHSDTPAKILRFIDLTSLNATDDKQTIVQLCHKAQQHTVATVCILPRFVQLAKQQLINTPVRIATIANFPDGNLTHETVLENVATSLLYGADEIDLVIPYRNYLQGDRDSTIKLISDCKALCGQRLLKTILETGELQTEATIHAASCDALAAGADMLKTSTGKVKVNATLEAATIMLDCIRTEKPTAGLKVAGGIQTLEQAQQYIRLVENTMDKDWLTLQHFRIGASSLLDKLAD